MKKNASLTVEYVLNWHSRNICCKVAHLSGRLSCLHHHKCIVLLTPPVLPWSAGTLILLLTPHLYQPEPNFCMISVIYAAGTECAHL